MKCPNCGFENPGGFKFCGNCTHPLDGHSIGPEKEIEPAGERKHVTIMFSDLSGYTAMTEKLDPEEVKEIMSRIFEEITRIIKKYDGFIERFVGDAVMAIFGVPQAHEDDPIRAIRTALEIHAMVEAKSPELEPRVGRPLSMHTGINTGLVVTGEVTVDRGAHGLTGDAINLASRLEGLAGAGEIVVGESTWILTRDHFNFEVMSPTEVKGKSEPVSVYKVVSVRDQQTVTQRLDGVKADLVGREKEMSILSEAVSRLKEGQISIISIVGEAGTGKSRLTREFKASLNSEEVQWQEGHAYAYTQNTAYYPLTNLLSYAFEIREGDKADQIREKIDAGVKALLWDKPEVSRYLGGLFSIVYDDMEDMSPEFWRKQLQQSVLQILDALAMRGPTVLVFEDLHWADVTFVELLRFLLNKAQRPVLFICVYRPSFSLFSDGQLESLTWSHQVIELRELSWDHTQAMLHSLLKSPDIPDELRDFIREKVEGNPFYLEEVINTLIETGILTTVDGVWQLTKSLSVAHIPRTIQGVLTARVDRLENEAKRILQEASVIGRAFFFEVLSRITELVSPVDDYLTDLVNLDLIRIRTREPDLEYIFKHALTQEVVYNGLLKKERREIHERIGQTMEKLFIDRLPEFYETLAFHYSRGKSKAKAIAYLIKAGEKSLARYAVEESNAYYEKAFDTLREKQVKSQEENHLLIDIIIKWSLVYYYRGDFKGLLNLLSDNKPVADSLMKKELRGSFYAWLGFAQYVRNNYLDSYENLMKALRIGEHSNDNKTIGYSCAWLSYLCGDLGLFDESLRFSERALGIARSLRSDPYLFFKPLGGVAQTAFYMGKAEKAYESGSICLDIGRQEGNVRSTVMGYIGRGIGHMINGDFNVAIEHFIKAVECSGDPFYHQAANYSLGSAYVLSEQFSKAHPILKELRSYDRSFGCEWAGVPADLFFGVTQIASGKMSSGFKMVKEALYKFERAGRKPYIIIAEYILGKIFFTIMRPTDPIGIRTFTNNFFFILKNRPFAGKLAEFHLSKAISLAKEINAKGLLAQAYLEMGYLNIEKKSVKKARKFFFDALEIFEENKANFFIKKTKMALESLNDG